MNYNTAYLLELLCDDYGNVWTEKSVPQFDLYMCQVLSDGEEFEMYKVLKKVPTKAIPTLLVTQQKRLINPYRDVPFQLLTTEDTFFYFYESAKFDDVDMFIDKYGKFSHKSSIIRARYIEALTGLWNAYHMPFAEIIRQTGLSQIQFSYENMIPINTLRSWLYRSEAITNSQRYALMMKYNLIK